MATGSNPPQNPPPTQVDIDDSHAASCYANFCRVTGTPEEVILDLGLNTSPPGSAPTEPVHVQQRVVMNYYTAKRMYGALQLTIKRHEENFGALETDIRKRLKPQSQAGGQQPPAKPKS